MPNPVRRVVTGHDAQGRSIVVSDGPAPSRSRQPSGSGVVLNRRFQIGWGAGGHRDAPIGNHRGAAPATPDPSRNGHPREQFPPEPKSVGRMTPEDLQRAFASLGNAKAATFGKGGRHPLMHRTETIDYAIVVSGEITMLLDVGEGAQGGRHSDPVRDEPCLGQSVQCARDRYLRLDRWRVRAGPSLETRRIGLGLAPDRLGVAVMQKWTKIANDKCCRPRP